MTDPASRRRAPWSEEIRRAAEEHAVDLTLSAEGVRLRIAEDLGEDVPLKTVARWVADVRTGIPVDRKALLSDAADRAAVLLRAEVARIERCQPHKRDLNRLDQAVRTLKTLDGIDVNKRGGGVKTLSDLNAAASEAQNGKSSQLAAVRASAPPQTPSDVAA